MQRTYSTNQTYTYHRNSSVKEITIVAVIRQFISLLYLSICIVDPGEGQWGAAVANVTISRIIIAITQYNFNQQTRTTVGVKR